MNEITDYVNRFWLRLSNALVRALDSIKRNGQRGDVPGWVLVLLMTAGLVTVMWAVAGPKLTALLTSALDSVSGR
jgi:hypothetical protein